MFLDLIAMPTGPFHPDPTRARGVVRAARLWAWAACWGAGVLGAGCHQSALSAKDERSQFDRYDQARYERAPAYLEDEFGRRRPNLRGRLLGND